MYGQVEPCTQEISRPERTLDHGEASSQGCERAALSVASAGRMRTIDPWLFESVTDGEHEGFGCHLSVYGRSS